jgi:hypothetical protein
MKREDGRLKGVISIYGQCLEQRVRYEGAGSKVRSERWGGTEMSIRIP